MKKLTLILFVAILSLTGYAQQNASSTANSWTKKNPFEQKVFIENKGQYLLDEKAVNANDILFAAEIGHQVYLKKTGFICRMSQMEFMTEEEERRFEKAMKSSKSQKEAEEEENERVKRIPHRYDVNMEWVGANSNVEIVVEDKVEEYFNFLNPTNRTKSIERVAGYKKVIYKNLYPGIDVVYTFHPETGLKYNLILHPGADASLVKMKYTGAKKVYKDDAGNICFTTSVGIMTDKAPETFYENSQEKIASSFNLKNNEVTFILGHMIILKQ